MRIGQLGDAEDAWIVGEGAIQRSAPARMNSRNGAAFAVNHQDGHAVCHANAQQHSGPVGYQGITRPSARRGAGVGNGVSSQLVFKRPAVQTRRNTVNSGGVRLSEGCQGGISGIERLKKAAHLLLVA